MDILINKAKANFTQVSNIPLRDNRLSWKAKGIFSYLSSNKDDWVVTMHNLKSMANEGITSLRSGIKELEQYGYLERTRRFNSKGQIVGMNWILKLPKNDAKVEKTNDEKNHTTENPYDGKPTLWETYTHNNTKSNNTKSNNTILNKEKEFKNSNPPPKKEKVNYSLVVDWYHEYCPKMAKVIKLSDGRKQKIRARIKEMPNGINDFKKLFKKVGESEFLNQKENTEGFARFDWFIKNSNNWVKTMEGAYDNRVGKDKPKKRHSELTNPDITGGKNDYVSMFKN